jgi:hypothetical protein
LITQSSLQPTRFTACEIKQMRMMNHTVEQSGGDFCVGENVIPTGKFEVRRNDNRLSLVTLITQ